MKFNTDKNEIICVVFLFIITICLFAVDINKHSNKVSLKNTKETESAFDNEMPEIQQEKDDTAPNSQLVVAEKDDNIVILNTSTMKFHKTNCRWAANCKNCIKVPYLKAKQQGAVPCKSCYKKHN